MYGVCFILFCCVTCKFHYNREQSNIIQIFPLLNPSNDTFAICIQQHIPTAVQVTLRGQIAALQI